MKTVTRWSLIALVAMLSATALAQDTSLGETARKNRARQQQQQNTSAKRTWTNDDIPSIPQELKKENAEVKPCDKAADPDCEKKQAEATAAKAVECDKTKDAECEKKQAADAAKPTECDKTKDADCEKKQTEAAAAAPKTCDKTKDADCKEEVKDAKADAAKASEDEKKKKADAYKKDLEAAQKAVADLQRESSLSEREWKLQQAAYYGDAGTRLRDEKKFADSQANHQKDINKLNQSIQDAQKKLDAIKEQARKDGVNL